MIFKCHITTFLICANDSDYLRDEINKYINDIMLNQPSNSRYRINVIVNSIKYSDNGSEYEKAYVKEM